MDFFVKKSTKTGKEDYCSIYARVRGNGLNKKYAIGMIVKITEWDTYNSKRYDASAMVESLGIRYGLFANILEQIKFELEENFNPDAAASTIRAIRDSVLSAFDKKKKRKNYVNKVTLTDFLQKLIEDFKSGQRTAKGKPLSTARIRKYVDIHRTIGLFEQAINEKIYLDDIDMDFQKGYVSWLKECGWSPNTISPYMRNLRYALSIAIEEKLTKNTCYLNPDFAPKGEEVDNIFLTPSQIQQLADFDLSSRKKIATYIEQTGFEDPERKNNLLAWLTDVQAKHIEESRDLFLVGCYTGQRFSDFSRISTDNLCTIKGKKFLKIVQQKTNKTVVIPYDVRVKAILKKYKGEVPHIEKKEVNENLKLIGELIGWTYIADIDETKMGVKKGPRFCDMISTHTARRSFASNAYAAGVPLSSIIAVTGHSREETLRIYLKLQPTEKATIAAKDFKGVLDI